MRGLDGEGGNGRTFALRGADEGLGWGCHDCDVMRELCGDGDGVDVYW